MKLNLTILLAILVLFSLNFFWYSRWYSQVVIEPIPVVQHKDFSPPEPTVVVSSPKAYVIPTFKPTSTPPTFAVPKAMPPAPKCYWLMEQKICE